MITCGIFPGIGLVEAYNEQGDLVANMSYLHKPGVEPEPFITILRSPYYLTLSDIEIMIDNWNQMQDFHKTL